MEIFYQTLQNLGYTHPIHPTIVYLPIGGVMAALIFGIIAVILNRYSFVVSARHSSVLAFFAAFPTILLGYMDWQYYHAGTWMFPIRMKIYLAAALVVLLLITILSHYIFRAGMKTILFLYSLCFINVVAIGYYGGEVVFAGSHWQLDAQEQEKAEDGGPQEEVAWADISVIFEQHCNMCHSGTSAPHDLRLDSYEQVMEGSENGKVIIPNKPGESELVLRMKGRSEPAMPFRQPLLPEETTQTIVRWVDQGAPESTSGKTL